MNLDLVQLWNGRRAPRGLGGPIQLALDRGMLCLSWKMALAREPRVPEARVGFLDGLWEHDVVELFLVTGQDRSRYLELEFGPAGHWLALSFDGVRQRAAELRELHPHVDSVVTAGRWKGAAALPLQVIERHAGPRPWHGLVAAVLAGDHGTAHLSWPALPGERPDFHQPAAWAPMVPTDARGSAATES